ncbi:MAG: methionyl-tRNA formyltransferase [Pirellulaceae bacterium]
MTNLTTEVNQSVLASLIDSQDIDLKHVYFFDTLADTKRSFFQTLRQHGVRRILEKLLGLIFRNVQTRIAKITGTELQPQNCFELVTKKQVPFSLIQNMNAKNCRDHLAESEAEYLIVCVCKNILRKPVLEQLDCTAINIHPSLLPEYRGPMPTYWIRKHKRSQTGVTIHLMTPGIDDGPILAQMAMPLSETDSVRTIEKNLFRLAADKLPGTLLDLHNGVIKPRPQDEEQATYYGFP